MRKFAGFIILIAVLLTCCTACSGYNRTMRDHLGKADNYHTYEILLKDMYYIDPSTNGKMRDFADRDFFENDVILAVSFFNSVEELIPFLGHTPDENTPLNVYSFQFRLTDNNCNVLASNDFFTNVNIGERICVRASDFIYMDSEYFFVAQLNCNGKEYLSFDEGFKNIVDMMDQEKSLF